MAGTTHSHTSTTSTPIEFQAETLNWLITGEFMEQEVDQFGASASNYTINLDALIDALTAKFPGVTPDNIVSAIEASAAEPKVISTDGTIAVNVTAGADGSVTYDISKP